MGSQSKPSCQMGNMSNSKCLTLNTPPQTLCGVQYKVRRNRAGTKPLLGP